MVEPTHAHEVSSISSLISLLKALDNFKESDKYYGLFGCPDPQSRQQFIERARAVDKFTITDSHDSPKILKTTFLWIARELKGEPLFPALRHLKMEAHEVSVLDFLPLLASPSLEYVNFKPHVPIDLSDPSANPSPDQVYMKLVIEEFIADLITRSRNITTLTIDNYPRLPVSWLQLVCSMGTLRVLKLAHLVGIDTFDPFRPLQYLRALESLSLDCQGNYYGSDRFEGRPPFYFKSLQELNLTAPLKLITDFLAISSPSPLASLTLIVTDTPPPPPPPPTYDHYGMWYSYEKSRPAPRSCLQFGHWTLRTISITLGHHIDYSLEGIYNLQAIQRFHVHGSYNLSIRAAHLNYFNKFSNLTSLHFCSTLDVMLTELAVLARSAPLLEDVALPINGWPPNSISDDIPPHHPLKILSILKKTEGPNPASRTSECTIFEKSEADISDLSSFINIARFLDRVFPRLQTLVAEENHQVWDAIFQIVKACQATRAGSKN